MLGLLALRGCSQQRQRALLGPLLLALGSAVAVQQLLADPDQASAQDEGLALLTPIPNQANWVSDQWQLVQQLGLHLIRLDQPSYPPLLRAIPDPPLALFVRGEAALLNRPAVAIVGSRRASLPGKRLSSLLAGQLATAGCNIISGLALGIDAAAHQGALTAGGLTTAVLGGGHGRLYPAGHAALAQQILAAGGVLVSEYPPGLPAAKHQFPARNRIISGLSLGVLVVEAGVASGSLITARLALEQGREVMAVPGPVTAPGSHGCHGLIKQGAALVESAADVLSNLNLAMVAPDPTTPASDDAAANLDPASRRLLALLAAETLDADSLCAHLGLPLTQVLRLLTNLELKGFVDQQGAGYSRRPGH